MIGILVQIILSWLLLWFFCHKHLRVLGLTPTIVRVRDFTLFLLLTAIFCITGFLLKIYFGNQHWQVNPQLSLAMVSQGIWWNIKSVLFEELTFRGALLYILIKKISTPIAVVISAVAFGIYHWFSLNVLGNVIPMIIVFITTGIMGLLLAYAFVKTHSLYLPIGIHFGWNFTKIFIFSEGPTGDGLFIQVPNQPFRTDSYIIFFIVTFLPILLMLLTNYLLLRKKTSLIFR